MNDKEKLAKLTALADECRRLQRVTKRPMNAHEAREVGKAEAALDFFLANLQTEVLAPRSPETA